MFNLSVSKTVNVYHSSVAASAANYINQLELMSVEQLSVQADMAWSMSLNRLSDLMRNVIMAAMEDETISDEMVAEAIRDTYVNSSSITLALTLAGMANVESKEQNEQLIKKLFKGRRYIIQLALSNVIYDTAIETNLQLTPEVVAMYDIPYMIKATASNFNLLLEASK